MIPYTYLIGWSRINKYYYGVQYRIGCDPSDLWTKYWTSSYMVNEYRELYGEPDIIQVRKQFTDIQPARLWEHKVLRRMKVVKNDMWINQTDNISFSVEACKKGAAAVAEKYPNGIGIVIASVEQRKEWASLGGKSSGGVNSGSVSSGEKTGADNVSLKRGWFGISSVERKNIGDKVGEKLVSEKLGFHNPKFDSKRSDWARKAGLSHTGKYWVFKEGKKKLIKEELLQQYIIDGWRSPRLDNQKNVKKEVK